LARGTMAWAPIPAARRRACSRALIFQCTPWNLAQDLGVEGLAVEDDDGIGVGRRVVDAALGVRPAHLVGGARRRQECGQQQQISHVRLLAAAARAAVDADGLRMERIR